MISSNRHRAQQKIGVKRERQKGTRMTEGFFLVLNGSNPSEGE
jgi:hypothetical protein